VKHLDFGTGQVPNAGISENGSRPSGSVKVVLEYPSNNRAFNEEWLN
jgi:hypothetical protein